MASSVFIGWFGGLPFSTSGSTATITGSLAVTGQFIGPAADNTAAPPFSFSGDLNTGVGSSAADTLNLITGGTSRIALSTTTLTSTVPILAPSGTDTAPGLSFSAEAGLGFFRNGSNDLRIALAGAARHAFTQNAIAILSDTGRIDFGSSLDVSLARAAANRLRLASGDVFNLAPTAFASLPTGAEGDMASVTDSNTATWGATIAGGGANNVLAYFNGTNWTVAGA